VRRGHEFGPIKPVHERTPEGGLGVLLCGRRCGGLRREGSRHPGAGECWAGAVLRPAHGDEFLSRGTVLGGRPKGRPPHRLLSAERRSRPGSAPELPAQVVASSPHPRSVGSPLRASIRSGLSHSRALRLLGAILSVPRAIREVRGYEKRPHPIAGRAPLSRVFPGRSRFRNRFGTGGSRVRDASRLRYGTGPDG
jgi:hypothetical protein